MATEKTYHAWGNYSVLEVSCPTCHRQSPTSNRSLVIFILIAECIAAPGFREADVCDTGIRGTINAYLITPFPLC